MINKKYLYNYDNRCIVTKSWLYKYLLSMNDHEY